MKYLLILILFIATNLQAEQATSKKENQDSNAEAPEETVEYIAPEPSNIFSLGWNAATNLSDQDFAGQSSFRGGEFDFQSYLTNNFTLGLSFMWSRFTEKRGRETYERGTSLINAVSWRYLEVNPIILTFSYRNRFSSVPKLQWHVGLGTGAYSVYQRLDFGIYVATEKTWSWGITPVAGVTYWLKKNTGLAFNLKYSFVLYDKFNFNNINMLVYNLALSFSVN